MLCVFMFSNNLIADKIPARLVLYFLSWSGFLVSFMMRNDMNFALVAMISNGNETLTENQSVSNTLYMVIHSFINCYTFELYLTF